MIHTAAVEQNDNSQTRLSINVPELNRMDGWLREAKIKDVVLVQDGDLLWEWYDKGADRVAPVFSCTKSILSALIGIVTDDGHLSLEQTVSEFF